MKQKITIFQKREWSKTDERTGETIEKVYYAGFPEKGKPFEFSSRVEMEHEVFQGMLKYDPEKNEEIDISAIFDSFKGVMKFCETGSQGASV